MNTEAMAKLVNEATAPLRKGEVVTERETEGGVHVTEVYGYPHEDDVSPHQYEKYDCHFCKVGVYTESAAMLREEFLRLLEEASEEERDQLNGGPSYIVLGATLGSQILAFQFMALGAHFGLWNIVTPGILGITGPRADAMAGGGLVMTTGWRH